MAQVLNQAPLKILQTAIIKKCRKMELFGQTIALEISASRSGWHVDTLKMENLNQKARH